MKVINEAFEVNKARTQLSIGNNNIKDEGEKAIGEALRTNKILTMLALEDK